MSIVGKDKIYKYDINYVSNETFKRTILMTFLVLIFSAIIISIAVKSIFPEMFDTTSENDYVIGRKKVILIFDKEY